MPDGFFGRRVGFAEVNLEKETAFKCTVKIGTKIGGGNEDTVKVFHLLQQYVLEGVLGLGTITRVRIAPLAKKGICLVK